MLAHKNELFALTVKALLVGLFYAGCFIAIANTYAQLPDAVEQKRINQLYERFSEVIHQPVCPPSPCLLPAGQQTGPTIVKKWLGRVPMLQHNGDSLCAFQLLYALLPAARREPTTYRQWLLARIQALQTAQQPDAVVPLADELAQYSQSDRGMLGWAILEKAISLNRHIQYESALRAGNEALLIARAEHDRRLEVAALRIVGETTRDIYRQLPAKYEPYHQKALEIARSLNDSSLIISAYRSLAYAHLYDESADLLTVLGYMEQSLPYLGQRCNLLERYKLVWTLADALSYLPETQQKAAQLYQALLPIAQQLHRLRDCRVLYHYLSGVAISRKQYVAASTYLDSAARYDSPDWEKDHFYQDRAEVQTALGNLSLANRYYQQALAEKERVYLRRNSQSMTQWETQFRTQEKEQQLDRQKQWQWWLSVIAGLVTLLFGIAVFAFFRNRQQLRLLARQHTIIETQRTALQRLDEAKTRFFANITHEFRTPLTLIISPLDELIAEMPRHRTLHTIRANATRLLTLINQLLDLSKLDAGVLRVAIQPENLTAFMQQQEELFRELAVRRGLHLNFSTHISDTDIAFDADKVSKILTNLLGNALKFTPVGGRISVQTTIGPLSESIHKQKILNLTNQRYLHIRVADTGLGMSAEQMAHIFDRFYQADDSTNRLFEGSGIGLSLVNELVTVLNGTIRVESESGRGTQFFLTLPITETPRVSRPESAQPDVLVAEPVLSHSESFYHELPVSKNSQPGVAEESKAVLLIVEDNEDLRTYIANLFTHQHTVITAADGQEGLGLAFELIPDIVITDWMMPRLDGVSLCRQLKADLRTSHVPVLMLTAKAATASRLSSFESGADDHIIKPFHARELQLKVQNWLDRQHQMRQRYQQHVAQLPDTPPIPDGEPAFLQRVFTLIDQHLAEPLFGVEQLAGLLGLNRRTLHRKLVSLTGLPPIEVIRNHRLHRALPRLRAGQPIADVAFQVGFESPSYFSKCFREVFGQKPSSIEKVL